MIRQWFLHKYQNWPTVDNFWERNRCLFEYLTSTPSSMIQKLQNMLEEDVSRTHEVIQNRLHQEEDGWIPPPVSVIKVNTDAGYIKLTKCANLRVVARDSNENIISSAVTTMGKIKDALWAEVAAVKFGLILATMKGFNQILVETDSAVTVKLLSQGEDVWWEGGSLIQDILDLKAECDVCDFLAVRRNADKLAHKLEKVPCNYNEALVANTIPDWILDSGANKRVVRDKNGFVDF
ncbi:hypothetical protein DITRI_Ditri19aG0112300 [Diplodiscus trichospermus]